MRNHYHYTFENENEKSNIITGKREETICNFLKITMKEKKNQIKTFARKTFIKNLEIKILDEISKRIIFIFFFINFKLVMLIKKKCKKPSCNNI